ncbi:hypothetical protein [Lactiplantibacillus plantarum]|uniref:hypothetical protein n=1 Tax=Lactiplantibacillus plantarum TaxID=1590 RepID=UPI001BA483AB|nr:hypothetical protein [Lactiplantibacillus plantarum]MBS0936336.1 hypothetical protein [Lactiplantibacillus plantarum]MBS0943765.1 hypothetical protein [Lactiplantibacillus plantarum]
MNKKNYQFDPKVVKNFFDFDYHDRGMVKWQGFYLSDHQIALKKEKAIRDKQHFLAPQQSLETVSSRLGDAYYYQYPVIIQLSELNTNGDPIPDIQTLIHGYNGDTIVIDNDQFISLSKINHIEKAR